LNSALPEPGADERAHSDRLAALLRTEIAAQGPIPFSRWMERCLYAPGLGYYSAGRTKFGAAGDFVTAPELGSLFAETIAAMLAPALRDIGREATFVELGGGSGAFAEAALRELAALGVLPARYAILEPGADLRERQRARLDASLPAELRARVAWIERPPEDPWSGVLFANEVVDALPATRFTIRGGEVFEEFVTTQDDVFAREDRPADPLVAGAVRGVERDLGRIFADGSRSEILPQLPYWVAAATATLEAGVALFVDYGYPRREYYLPERRDGTLICHYRHRAHADPLLWPGLTDISAFVDFTALAEAGVGAGFELAVYAPQGPFLLGGGLGERIARFDGLPDIERLRRTAEVKRLTLPGEMGERFQAMAFARGVEVPAALCTADLSRRL
jgi:SAM-dependent MidA family methyltransferase